MLVLGGRGCRLNAYVHAQGERGPKLQNLSIHTLWMTPLIIQFT